MGKFRGIFCGDHNDQSLVCFVPECKRCGRKHWDDEDCPELYNTFYTVDIKLFAESFLDAALKRAEISAGDGDHFGVEMKISVSKGGITKNFKITPEPGVNLFWKEIK